MKLPTPTKLKGLTANRFYKYTLVFTLTITLFSSLFFLLHSKNPPPQKLKIYISQIIDHPALNETQRGILDGLKNSSFCKDKDLDIQVELAQGKPTIAMQIAQKFMGEQADVMVGIATTTAQALASKAKGAIPVVYASVTDPVGAKLVRKGVTGVSNFTELKPQFELFKKLVPTLKRLGIVYNPGEANSQAMLEKSIEAGLEAGIEIVPSPALKTSEVPSATRKLMGKVEAIFINNDNTALAAFETVVKVATEFKIPVFSSDTDLIDRGALASLGPNQYDLGLQTARIIIDILKGKKAEEIPFQLAQKLETKINHQMKEKLGIGG